MKRYLLLFLLLCGLACGATYHAMATAQGAANGTSKANAWAFTTAMLATSIAAGDTVYLYDDAGSFGDVTMDDNSPNCAEGTAGNPITFVAYPGETPFFHSLVFASYAATEAYLVFDGLTIDPSGVQGTYTTAISIAGGGNFTFQNCLIYSDYESYTTIYGRCYSRSSVRSAVKLTVGSSVAPHNITFTNCKFKCDNVISTPTVIFAYDIMFDGCTFSEGGADGWVGVAQNLTIQNCTFYDQDWHRTYQVKSGGTESGVFTPGETITQAVSGATGIVAETISGVTYWHQSSATAFVANQTITGATSGQTISGTFSITTAHSDAIQVVLSSRAIATVTVGNPTQITVTSSHGIKSGDTVYLTGLTGADAATLNSLEFTATYVGSTNFTIPVNTTGMTITPDASSRSCPVLKNLVIQRNKFYNISGNSAIYVTVAGSKSDNLMWDGITIESNLVYTTDTSYGIDLIGINTGTHANCKVNNNTVFATKYDRGIYMGVSATYGGCRVDQMYNNLGAGITIAADNGAYAGIVTAHDNNSFGNEVDTSNHWTNSANDLTNAVLTSDYFTNYAGDVYTLKAGSPAIDSGSVLGATLDINGATFGGLPERGCYAYLGNKLVLIRK
jgi:hypothetical protein